MENEKEMCLKIERPLPPKLWIQTLFGGLGNQILEYLSFRFVERRRTEAVCIWDDTFYQAQGDYVKLIEQFEKIFHIKLNRVSQYCDKDTLEELCRLYRKGIYLHQIMLDCGIPVISVSDWGPDVFKGITIKKAHGFCPQIAELPYNYVYTNALFGEKCWFMQDREANLAELSFPALPDAKNLKFGDQIRGHMSVGIHIRRGDFLQVGWAFKNECYRKSCKIVLERYPDAWFFVFSDDLDWCRKNAAELGLNLSKHTVYISGNEEAGKNYIDMQLLSMCQGIIRIGLSTFSEAASLLSRSLIFEVLIGDLHKYDPYHTEVKFFERARK